MNKSEIQVLDFDKICRLCLLEKRSMSAIFSKKKSDKKVPLPVRIMSCASLQLYEGDGLPSSICSKCLMSVNQSYAFREQCEQADTTLRQYAQRLNEASEEPSTSPFTVVEEFFKKFILKRTDEVLEMDLKKINEVQHPAMIQEVEISYTETDSEKQNTSQPDEGNDKVSVIVQKVQQETELLVQRFSKKKDCNSDLLKKLYLNSGITITKKSSTSETSGSKVISESKASIQLNKPNKVIANKAILQSFGEGSRIVQRLVRKKKISASVERQRKGFTTQEFFKEYAANADDLTVPRNSNKDDRVYCKVCKISIGRPYFYNHVKYVHKKVRNHLCQECGYRAHTGFILRQHMESQHSGNKLPCVECSMTFTCEKRLRFHIKKHHSGKPLERKHICQYCGKAFTTTHYLTNHIRVHTEETPYNCHYCERKFKFKWACKTHERLHTGVKPYKCNYCGESFTQNCVRKNHEYRVHGNEEFNPKNRIPKTGNRREKRTKKSLINVQPLELVEVVTGDSNNEPENIAVKLIVKTV